jgi:hypothetical protein
MFWQTVDICMEEPQALRRLTLSAQMTIHPASPAGPVLWGVAECGR